MNDELTAALASINKANKAASDAGQKVLEKRLLEISTALTDIAGALEQDKRKDAPEGKGSEHMAALVAAIKAIGLAPADVTVTPQIDVHPAVTVQASAPTVNVAPTPIQNHNHITVPAAAVTVNEREPWKSLHVEFEYVGDRIYGAKITRG